MVAVGACGGGGPGLPAPASPPSFLGPTNLGPVLNSEGFDGGPSISADGLSLYFVSDRTGGSGGGDILVATRPSTSLPFTKPQNLGSAVNSAANEGAPSISADGLELFFDRAPDGHIFVATRSSVSEPFGKPTSLNLATTQCCDGFPAISGDGLELYFCSNRPGGSGGDDIWVAKRASRSQPFGRPSNLGTATNGSVGDCEPSISKDGLVLFFASDRLGGSGGLDIWVATRASRSESFRRPTNLGPRFNSYFPDERPAISADGLTLYLMSNRPGGSGFFDLWQASRAAGSPG
jgi:Tol biopolymer transport system component